MIDSLPPGAILILGAWLLPLLSGRWRSGWMLLLPVLSGLQLLFIFPEGTERTFQLFNYQLLPVHIDRLSLVWGYIFHLATFFVVLYSLHVKDSVEQVSALVYAGSAIGAVFAGDLLTLFVYWELTAVSSVFLIWVRRNERAYWAGMRYLIIQVGSGVILLWGILLHLRDTGSLDFLQAFHYTLPSTDAFFLGLNSPGTALIFLAFGIKAAFPLLHNWLEDAYPEATVTGAVCLSVFTTKLAIYVLARGFPGTGMLVWIGAAMTCFPIFFAVIENDLRRVLSYSLINQLGFMTVGIGLANFAHYPEEAQLALNGTAAHAFAHILYKALLFMSMGAVLYRTGTVKGSELGGLYKSMPWTTVFCIIGAASISAFPLFSGFVTKSMILAAAAEEHRPAVWLLLLFASAGVLDHAGIKIPFFAFFAHDSGKRVQEAPGHMLLAMGLIAGMCILIGVFPEPLYAILPYKVAYDAYDMFHVMAQLQLLLFATLAFTVLKLTALYPPEIAGVNLDADWFYRKAIPVAVAWSRRTTAQIGPSAGQLTQASWQRVGAWTRKACDRDGPLGRSWSTGSMMIWATVLLGAYLVLYYL